MGVTVGCFIFMCFFFVFFLLLFGWLGGWGYIVGVFSFLCVFFFCCCICLFLVGFFVFVVVLEYICTAVRTFMTHYRNNSVLFHLLNFHLPPLRPKEITERGVTKQLRETKHSNVEAILLDIKWQFWQHRRG